MCAAGPRPPRDAAVEGNRSPVGKLPSVPELVAIDLPGGDAFVNTLRRVWDEGNAALPVDQRLSVPAKQALFDQLRPDRVTSAQGDVRLAGGVPVQPGDALVMATSGTTGRAKGAVLTHAAVAASAHATSSRLQVDPSRHRWLACLPLNHVGGLSVITRSMITGTPFDVLPRFDASDVLARSGPDVLVSLVATALRQVAPDRFRTVVLGGSTPPDALAANVVTTYGMTETGSGVVYDGVPLDGVEVALAAATGEILIRGPMLLRAYRDGSAPLDAAGWYSTGDAGRFDDAGRLLVDGRRDDMIVSGGENLWPAPIEAALRTHPGVAEVAVAGRRDEEWGQIVVAWVVPLDPAAPPPFSEIKALVTEKVAPFAAPRRVVMLAELPKTSIGKVRKDDLPYP